jgi:NAD+ synthase (glutamine-hydrolysing)
MPVDTWHLIPRTWYRLAGGHQSVPLERGAVPGVQALRPSHLLRPPVKLALCQINPVVGDLAGNAEKILDFARRAEAAGADLALFPELCITGYPPLDLLESPAFIDDVEAAVAHVAHQAPPGLGILIGAPVRNPGRIGKRLHNAALLYEGGRLVAEANKVLLPTYDVFDEHRYFEPASSCRPIEFRGHWIGVHVCEDMWNAVEHPELHRYALDPVADLVGQGVDLLVNISASPFSIGKHERRNDALAAICRTHGIPFVLVNQVGANTEIVFDGDSRVHRADGTRACCAPSFEEHLLLWDSDDAETTCSMRHDDVEDLHDALVLGIRDYFNKTGAFGKALIGLSGGIDSAVTCALAVEALGAERVVGVTMPGPFSSEGSIADSMALADNLGIRFYEVPIRPAVEAFGQMLDPVFAGTDSGVAEENIQARARGVTLMAISNKFDYLVLSTGNKSEMAVGYATLYGDMNGGLAVLSDVFKQEVYALAQFFNDRAGRELIPESTITKPPSAELRPDQTDQDTLPPYDVLDRILRLYVERLRSAEAIVRETGYDEDLVGRVLTMVDRSEYKRRQAAPGLRVSDKAFGAGRRMPIAMRRTRVEGQVR